MTASQRIKGWADYLSEFGYYPIIVTRNWDIPITSPEDASISTGTEIKHIKNDTHEVYYLPYKASLRDRIFEKNKDKKSLQRLSKIFTLKNLILENYSNSAIPYSNMYTHARRLIQDDSEIKMLVVSAKPFNQFKFGFLLHQEFGIKWIADYRDDWNTSELEDKQVGIMKYLAKMQSNFEKKWIATASCITSISGIYVKRISTFVGVKGEVILNGFDGLANELPTNNDKIFRITYNGSLYPSQSIEPILKMIKRVIDQSSMEIHLYFPGLGFDKTQENRVRNLMLGYEKNIHITNRVAKEDVIRIQNKSDVLLMIAHGTVKGVPSSKMYEYIGLKKPILVYPNDHDIVEETLNDTGLGIICENEEDIFNNLQKLILEKQTGEKTKFEFDEDKINFYSRKNQTAVLAKLFDELLV